MRGAGGGGKGKLFWSVDLFNLVGPFDFKASLKVRVGGVATIGVGRRNAGLGGIRGLRGIVGIEGLVPDDKWGGVVADLGALGHPR